jgi:hypothetical protein
MVNKQIKTRSPQNFPLLLSLHGFATSATLGGNNQW